MRKLIATVFLAAVATAGYAQDYKEVTEKLAAKNYTEAKTAIDKLASNQKATATSDYWFYRSQVYSGLGATDTAAIREAINSMDRYYSIESKSKEKANIRAVMENHKTAIDLYSDNFNAGVKNFQAQNWAAAEARFTTALSAFDMLSRNAIISQKFDTTTTLYAGYSAQNAKDMATAAYYYNRIVEQNIADTTMVGAYEFLINYAQQNKDEANFKKYLDIAKQRFPQYNANWTRLELSTLENDPAKKLKRLGELSKADPKDLGLATDYTAELFNYTYSQNKPSDYAARQAELEEALKSLAVNFPDNVYGNYVLTQHYSNQIYDLQQARNAIKGAKPEDIKKKQDIDKQIMAKFDALQPYGLKAISLFEAMGAGIKTTDKYNYKNVLNTMSGYYDAKKQPAKAKELEDKAKAIK
ncbi:hypothetical protein EPD60_00980 [Flaviaesturariibacter flavus]|uniref:Tetratricopeptide repeat protein n=1 Tax=Flaviaesturariibacter flavus TaxID=2502780 RepID=A0A4R1BN60_9BACT|nr:hypothetical protein [Flaviaesturariibacter flavus]TCJ19020.1 hypothetical protein EPD60_00980 [Flaviaesturariibacter flavus]